jgi:hypothetical protein
LSNSSSQSVVLRGGITPVTGRHSVIDNPEPVSRVAPPTITVAATRAATAQSQSRTGLSRSILAAFRDIVPRLARISSHARDSYREGLRRAIGPLAAPKNGEDQEAMRSRTRKLIGAAGLLLLAVFWPLLTLALGHSNLSRYYASGQIVFILVFGLIWLVPAALLIRWMQRPDDRAN